MYRLTGAAWARGTSLITLPDASLDEESDEASDDDDDDDDPMMSHRQTRPLRYPATNLSLPELLAPPIILYYIILYYIILYQHTKQTEREEWTKGRVRE